MRGTELPQIGLHQANLDLEEPWEHSSGADSCPCYHRVLVEPHQAQLLTYFSAVTLDEQDLSSTRDPVAHRASNPPVPSHGGSVTSDTANHKMTLLEQSSQ